MSHAQHWCPAAAPAGMAAALAAGVRLRGKRVAWWTLIAACAAAGLMLLRLFAEAGYRTALFGPLLLMVLLAATAFLLTEAGWRGLLAGATILALTGGVAALLLAAAPLPDFDPRHAMLGTDVGLASLALVPIAAACGAVRRGHKIQSSGSRRATEWMRPSRWEALDLTIS